MGIAISAAACTGNPSKAVPDTVKTDNGSIDTTHGVTGADANGAASAVDSGLDKSGSGGTDTIKRK